MHFLRFQYVVDDSVFLVLGFLLIVVFVIIKLGSGIRTI